MHAALLLNQLSVVISDSRTFLQTLADQTTNFKMQFHLGHFSCYCVIQILEHITVRYWRLTLSARYKRSESRQGYRSGHYNCNLTITFGDIALHVPRLK